MRSSDGYPPPPTTADSTARPVPRRGHLGSWSLAQILAAEASVLAVIAGLTQGLLPTVIAAAFAAVLLLVFFSRRQDRWWLEHRRIARALHRRRAARLESDAGPLLAALRTIAPGLTVRDIPAPHNGTTVAGAARDGTGVARDGTGVARDEAGWFSVVALDPATGPLPLDALAGLLNSTDQPGVVLALVTHTIPAPSPDVHPDSPAGSSYRQLVQAVSPAPVPAHRETSISVRVDARLLAEALLDHTADPESAAALAAGLGRKLVTNLRRLGLTARTLNAGEIVASLSRSCDVAPGTDVDESWTHWRSARLTHRTYWLRTWPAQVAEISSLFAWAATAPVALTSTALILSANGQDITVRALLRLATRPEADLQALDRMLLEGALQMATELQPLDGEHGPATYATAPTGGGPG
ncbi:type VII secretion protein EccE [Actinoplanes sp. GCM10030250]|uniref:type VII secretion protein EccE n=1 Tax=Actinoplanes sp. GCM10030250 TaxID=3273376 RepID=UPI00361DEE73